MVTQSKIQIVNGRKVLVTSPSFERFKRVQLSRERQQQIAQQQRFQAEKKRQTNIIRSQIKREQLLIKDEKSFRESRKRNIRVRTISTARIQASERNLQELNSLLRSINEGNLFNLDKLSDTLRNNRNSASSAARATLRKGVTPEFRKGRITKVTITDKPKPTKQPIASFEDPRILQQARKKKSITTFIPEIKTKQFSQSLLTAREREIIRTAKDKVKAVGVIADLRKQETANKKQKLERFLKVSLKPIETEEDVKSINNAIRVETKRLSNRSLQLEIAKSAFKGQLDKTLPTISRIKPRDIPIGIYKGVFNIGSVIVKTVINPRNKKKVNIVTDNIASEGIKLAFNYGKRLRTRFEKGENSPLVRDVNLILKTTGSGVNFVKDNPMVSALIVGVASTRLGTGVLRSFNKDPVATTTEAALILAPNKVLRGLKGAYGVVNRRVISKAFRSSSDEVVKANGLLVSSLPTWDVTFNKAKYLEQLRREADKLKKQKAKQDKKKQTPKVKAETKVINDKIKVVRNSSKAFKLNPETVSKGLSKLFEVPTPKVKVTKVLPRDVKQIETLLLEARKVGGREFAILKAKIKKQFNLNVVQRIQQGKVRFKLLEPKEQRRKGVLTAKSKVKQFEIVNGKIVVKKPSKIDIVKEKQKLSKKELKDLEFREGQNLDKIQNDIRRIAKTKDIFGNKKAQASISRGYSKRVKKNNDKIKNVSKKVRVFRNRVDKYKSRLRQPIKTRKQVESLRKQKLSIDKQKKALKDEITTINKELNKLKSIGATLTKLGFRLKILLDSLSKTVMASNNLLKSVNIIIPSPKPTPVKAPPKGRPTTKPKPVGKPPKAPRVAVKPKPLRKPPKAPPKPFKKPITLPKIRINLGTTPKTRKPSSGYIIRIKKGNKILAVSDKMLPRLRAENTARRIVNGTTGQFPLASSYEVVRVGKTNVRDDTKLVLENIFRRKRSKRTKVLISVEIRRARLNTKKEIKAAQKARKVKKKK